MCHEVGMCHVVGMCNVTLMFDAFHIGDPVTELTKEESISNLTAGTRRQQYSAFET